MFISHCSFQSNIVDDGNGGSILVSVSSEQIFSENSFINQENGVNITVNEFPCSDIKIQASSENFAETSMSNSDENTQDLLSFEQTETESTSLIEKSTNSEANEIESSINFVQTVSETTKSTFTDFEKSQSQPNEISDSISISFQSTKDDSLIENGSNKNKGSNIGMIIGIICGVVVVVAITILVTLLVLKKKKTNKEINLQTPNSNKKQTMKEETNLTDDDDSDLNFWL